ncbi:DUF4360 domain-containing protein [Lentzea sp. NPDC051213]|uniref:DUF4360 domain-containing protein n=1 Tax=Lentzea sp. NPDC051213 TaxID=3364126 RepID=UPI0037A891C4
MLNTAAVALFALSALAPAEATEEPAPRLEVVTVNGSGCPAGDADVTTTDRTFSVGYHTFLARAGGGSAPTDFRKNCQLNIRVNVPEGYTYGLQKTSYRGYVHLQEGASALTRISTYLQGSSETKSVSQAFTGPASESWQVSYRPSQAEIVWAPCGEQRNININAELRVTLGTADPERLNFSIAESSTGAVRVRRC